MRSLTTLIIALSVLFGLKAQSIDKNMDNNSSNAGDVKVLLKTSLGDITILLYGDTPRHRDNFVKLVKEGNYDGVLFHRVINDFMVQTGDPTSKNAPKGKMLGDGDMPYEIDAEFLFPTHYHHRGAIAAARQGDNVNPEKKSSGSQFYIVTGKKFTAGQLDSMEHQAVMRHKQEVFDSLAKQNRDSIMSLRRNRDAAGLQALQEKLAAETEKLTANDSVIYTPEIREAYMNEGGTPHLDGSYTVFGRVISGMDVVDKIQKAETDGNDRPLEDIRIISATILPDDK
ncbi:MAG: peptidylprolyl isomerase [Muribaculaceae bacterium]|nr:peptidylprolyl isomerase [Muribaculaceae bacterium]